MVKKVEAPQGDYHITGRIPNAKGVITHLQLNGVQVYSVEEIVGWARNGVYTFFTTDPNTNARTPVTVRGKKFMISRGNKIKEDNLDWLPIASLI